MASVVVPPVISTVALSVDVPRRRLPDPALLVGVGDFTQGAQRLDVVVEGAAPPWTRSMSPRSCSSLRSRRTVDVLDAEQPCHLVDRAGAVGADVVEQLALARRVRAGVQ